MQNLDFSGKLGLTNAHAFHDRSERESGSEPTYISKRNWLLMGALAFAVLSFTGGILTGIKIGHYKKIDSAILQKVAENEQKGAEAKTAPETFSQVAPDNETPPPAPVAVSNGAEFLILFGNFSPENAKKLLIAINGNAEISSLSKSPCKSIQETVPDRGHGFRLEHPSRPDLHRVFAGCYSNLKDAQKVFQLLGNSGILQKTDARLVEIK